MESAVEASTIQPGTQTFVPFIPSVVPEVTLAVSEETPSVAAEESAESTAGEPSGVLSSDTKEETVTEEDENDKLEVEEMQPTEAEEGPQPEEPVVTDGEAIISPSFLNQVKAFIDLHIDKTLVEGVETFNSVGIKEGESQDRSHIFSLFKA